MLTRIVFYFSLPMLLIACNQKPADLSSLQNRDGIYYQVNQAKPFSGKILEKDTINGTVTEGKVENGLKEGKWTASYANGQKESEGEFVDGQKDGTWTYWKENGQEARTEQYKHGNRLGEFEDAPNGGPESESEDVSETQTKSRSAEPESVNFTELVNIKMGGHYRKTLNGRPYTGPVVKYHSTGKAAIRGYYTRGIRSGTWTYYYKTGVVKDVKHF